MALSIAIIDSGINPLHPHVSHVTGGLAFKIDKNGRIIQEPDFSDSIGHGTAIAGIISGKAPFAEIYSVKIFFEKLNAKGDLLLTGLKWAIEKNMKIIHLSLGTEHKKYKFELSQLCNEAFNKNIVIVSAGRNLDDEVYPACFNSVIGVYWNRECGPENIIYHPGCNIEFGACGYPRRLPGIDQEKNFKGHSFAAAHITGKIASLPGAHPGADTSWVREQIIHQAEKSVTSKS